MKTVGILLINFNSWQETKACLESLSRVVSQRVELKILVVDNASESDVSRPISDFRKKHKNIPVLFIQNKENLGFAGGNNVGIKELLKENVDYVMLLNNDTIVASNFIDPLIELFETEPNAGIATPKIYFASGYEFHRDRYKESEKGKVIWYAGGIIDWDNVYASHRGVDEVDIGRYNTAKKTAFISGCCMMIKKDVFEKVGHLDERYFMYLEDVDFCRRAKQEGYKLWYVPQSIIWHKNAQSSGKPGSDIHVYYQTRNRLLFGFQYAPLRTKLALLRDSLRIVIKGGMRKTAVIDYYLGRLGKRDFHAS
ncbi:MAG: glycosyltransferase family 2 protein [Candidatus Roizmanbacteria bacterium]|nr:glycosyltransferase family 2 protein [Candidatus Roizmanbacteria bacterium]